MRALLDNRAVIHDDDAVGGAHGGQSMGDDHRSTIMHQPVQSILHQPLALGIERRRGLIKQQQWRVTDESAGDGNTLALSSGQARSRLTKKGIEAVGQFAQKLAGIGRIRRRPDICIAGSPVAVTEIVTGRLMRKRRSPEAQPLCGRGHRRGRHHGC